jgi:hypothetical protein
MAQDSMDNLQPYPCAMILSVPPRTTSPMAHRLPADLIALRKAYNLHSGNTFTTTNPKTEKNGKVSAAPTIVLHLEPVTYGVCPAAGSCAALCLHKAGNRLYFDAKLPARQRRSHAWQHERAAFLRNVVAEAARARSKGYVGVRLNGTSDIAWEREMVTLDPHLISWIAKRVPGFKCAKPGDYSMIAVMVSLGLQPYDYTKRVDRDFSLAAAMGYHLTLSWGGKHDATIFDVAARHGLNVAAPVYGIGKKQPLPETIRGCRVVDGDVTDWRRDDPADRVHIVGLRLKRTPGQTEELARRFCIA